ncbi:hypothetical protein EXIGLDRAFT_843673 [Exidia glandulosa HHB12029]|uniref:F-box domain-containing protein n=1 Tax=Exidia glandulosa HHB12029 TaxID=1314781 RepID=A0A165CHA9_EXIGL|nr:hypothetical protein EXIGLDRAFT_843673 [Exidia glandulosa HHB12029]
MTGHAATSGPFALPAELLCAILAYLPLKSRIAATHVCWSWRKVALQAAADLWAQIYWGLSELSSPNALAARLARAGGAPIDLYLNLTPRQLLTVIDIVAPYIGQLRYLRIRLGRFSTGAAGPGIPVNFSGETAPLLSLLTRSPAPMLKFLHVSVVNDSLILFMLILNKPLFQNVTPNLAFVNLDGIIYIRSDARHPTVSILRLGSRKLDLPRHLGQLLGPFPGLEVLDIRSGRYGTLSGSMPTMPAKLRALVLRSMTSQPLPPHILALIPHQGIKQVEYILEGDVNQILVHPFPTSAESVLVQDLSRAVETYIDFRPTDREREDWDDDNLDDFVRGIFTEVIVVDDLGAKRVFNAPHMLFMPDFLNHLHVLSITDTALYIWYQRRRRGQLRARFDTLRLINVYLLDKVADYATDATSHSLFFLPPPYPFVFDAPFLETISLTTHEDVTIAPEMVCDFLVYFLGRSMAPPLDLLELRNVRILEHCVHEVARLTLFAPTIVFYGEGLTWEKDVAHLALEADIDFR